MTVEKLFPKTRKLTGKNAGRPDGVKPYQALPAFFAALLFADHLCYGSRIRYAFTAAGCKRIDCKRNECKRIECRRADCKRNECNRIECGRIDCKRIECKRIEYGRID